MPLKNIIEARKLTYRRQGETIIESFDFTVKKGQLVGIIGPNGGGKTTLVRLIIGLLPPTSGTLSVFGEPPASRKARRRLSYVPQRGGNIDPLFPATIEEVVRSGLAGHPPRSGAVDETLSLLGIEPLRQRALGEVSGGERQRALLARALVSDPELLILDEPTDGLDPETRDAFYTLLRHLKRERGLTILLVSHDVHAVAREADAAICLKHELICHGREACHLSGEQLRNVFHAQHDVLVAHHQTHHHE